MKQYLPNFITCLNIVSGVLGVIFILENQVSWAIYCVFVSMVLDFLDGFLARLLKAQSALGKQLDSLADLVSFGILPALILYSTILVFDYWKYIVIIIPVFSALRLAKFNIDESQNQNFKGVPTPANALFLISIPFLLAKYPTFSKIEILVPVIFISAFLLVLPIPILSLKFKDFSFQHNFPRYIFITLSIIFFSFWQFIAIPIIFLTYILLSLVFIKKL